jgi:excisionase family DNA binding protein
MVDYPFVMGKMTDFFVKGMLLEKDAQGKARFINHPFVNDAGIFKQVISGEMCWYFVILPKGRIFQKLICEPRDSEIDLYVMGPEESVDSGLESKICHSDRSLLFGFYTSSTNKTSITAELVDDTRCISSKIQANLTDIELRSYFMKQCMAKSSGPMTYEEKAPSLMIHNEASKYLGVSPKTLYNWVSSGKIKVTKAGKINKFRRKDLEEWLEEHIKGPLKHKGVMKQSPRRRL